MWDILHFHRAVPMVAIERQIAIPEVAEARLRADPKPGWYPILLKAFALAAARVPELRQSLLTFPYTRLYEHASSVATVTVERELDGEPTVFVIQIREPEAAPLTKIDARLKWVKTAPLCDIAEFRRWQLLMRFPRPLRRLLWWLGLRVSGLWRQKYWGTFAATSIVSAGATVLVPVCPLTSLFTFGPVGSDGSLLLRLAFDHRVLDGVAGARMLVETENALRNEILAELRALVPSLRLAV